MQRKERRRKGREGNFPHSLRNNSVAQRLIDMLKALCSISSITRIFPHRIPVCSSPEADDMASCPQRAKQLDNKLTFASPGSSLLTCWPWCFLLDRGASKNPVGSPCKGALGRVPGGSWMTRGAQNHQVLLTRFLFFLATHL